MRPTLQALGMGHRLPPPPRSLCHVYRSSVRLFDVRTEQRLVHNRFTTVWLLYTALGENMSHVLNNKDVFKKRMSIIFNTVIVHRV